MSGNAILKELVTASKAGRPAGIGDSRLGRGVSDRGNGKPGQPVWRLHRNDTG